MEKETLISVLDFCVHHQISDVLVYELRDFGFVEVIDIEENSFLSIEELPKLERILRFNQEFQINLEGIEVIFNLLEKLEETQKNNKILRNKIAIYEQM